MKHTLLFTIIASVLTTGAYATSATVTSKDYVDARDALKQNTIPATGTNSSTPGSTVVTYTSTAGTIGERGICNDPDEDDCNGGDLVTVNQLDEQIERLGLQTVTTTNRTCVEWVANAAHTDANCLLWSLVDQTVFGIADLVPGDDWAVACWGEGGSCSDDSQCCDGFWCSGGRCTNNLSSE